MLIEVELVRLKRATYYWIPKNWILVEIYLSFTRSIHEASTGYLRGVYGASMLHPFNRHAKHVTNSTLRALVAL
jgi:hypothetical protein